MVIQAVKSLPKTNTYSFIALENLFYKNDLKKVLNSNFENIRIKLLNKITDGQCSTCLSAINEIPLSNQSLLVLVIMGHIQQSKIS